MTEIFNLMDVVNVNDIDYTVTGRSFHGTDYFYDLINGDLDQIKNVPAKDEWILVKEFKGPICECVTLPGFGKAPIRRDGCPHIRKT